MAQVEGREKRYISTPMSNFRRDLLQRFIPVNHLPLPVKLEEPSEDADADADADAEELELTLGLSLNGRFGVDPTAKKIKRTSSIPEFVNPVRDEDMAYVIPMACAPLIRTCSLPTETEEEWRKRKELQTLRRMEARRKRSEKQQKNLKALRERNRAFSEEIGEDDSLKRSEGVEGSDPAEHGAAALNEFTSLLRTTSLTSRGCGLRLNAEKGGGGGGGGGLPPPPPSQGSIGSQGTGWSGISESECQPAQGTKSVDGRSPISAKSLPEGEQKLPVTSGIRVAENSGKTAATKMRNQSDKLPSPENRTKDIVRNLLEDMPCVSTKGDGPNGKRIEGFLYRYRKGEEVRIVCVCHGSFLTPAEFVEHAGGSSGGGVANPLKHIVVSPSLL